MPGRVYDTIGSCGEGKNATSHTHSGKSSRAASRWQRRGIYAEDRPGDRLFAGESAPAGEAGGACGCGVFFGVSLSPDLYGGFGRDAESVYEPAAAGKGGAAAALFGAERDGDRAGVWVFVVGDIFAGVSRGLRDFAAGVSEKRGDQEKQDSQRTFSAGCLWSGDERGGEESRVSGEAGGFAREAGGVHPGDECV